MSNARGTTAGHLDCRALRVQRGGRTVLHDISLTLDGRECVALVGPNGSGKTTLLLALLGLLTPAGGQVRLDGRTMHRIPARRRARFAAYVPQRLERVPALRVADAVALGRYPHLGTVGRATEVDAAAVRSALDRCGLTALAARPLTVLSGGERQKTLLAAAIAQDAQMLFLDEPNTALDPAYQLELVRVLRQWHANGRGVLVISHDLQLPAALGGRVIALRAGRVVADGPAGEVLDATTLERIYDAPFGVARTLGGATIVLPAWWSVP